MTEDIVSIQQLADEVKQLRAALAQGRIPVSPDLNGDGRISPVEQATYDIFKGIIEKTQKNALLTNILIVVFCIASFLFSLLGVQL